MDESINATRLNDCGCCEGIAVQTPVDHDNRPGLAAIAYRVGTYPQFKHSLLAQLSTPPALQTLTTREDDDFAIALLDAWAIVADVLTFYQERIANESYLRTATERFSLLQLARLIGYQLRPGVAASTYLAFTLEDAPGVPKIVTIDVGLKVQSVPGKDETPQTFETVEKITARTEWNAIKPRLTQPQILRSSMAEIRFKGLSTNLKRGDGLLIVTETNQTFRRIKSVTTENLAQETRVELEGLSNPFTALSTLYKTPTFGLATQPLNNATIQTQVLGNKWNQTTLESYAEVQGWKLEEFSAAIAALQVYQPPANTGVFVFRSTAALFGYSAPDRPLYGADGKPQLTDGVLKLQPWTPAASEAKNQLYLDSAYDGITVGSYIAIRRSPDEDFIIAKVTQATTTSRTEYGISGKTIRLTIDRDWWNAGANDFNTIRKTIVYTQSESLNLTEIPISDEIKDNQITLDRLYEGLKPGHHLILTGEVTNPQGVTRSEVITVKQVNTVSGNTEITLVQSLKNIYVRSTVILNGNAILATHGETVQEVLGSGNASQAYQTFTLRQPPLTHISSDSAPGGAASTLQIRVNELLWHEAPMLYGQNRSDRIYISRLEDNGKTLVEFGNGKTGARLPTGQENIKATYRKGIGSVGNVKAGQLTTLLSRPLGVKGVTNPGDATGGDHPETRDRARRNAPLTVLTLGRIVSLQDYEDFASAFMGIGKALATWTWNRQARGVFVTVAGAGGAAIAPDSQTYQNLVSQMKKFSDPYIPLQVQSYRKALFHLKASLKIAPDFIPETVLAQAQVQMKSAFSFEMRAFGQGVALSQVVAVLQSVPGVMAIDVDALYRLDGVGGDGLTAPLPAKAPQAGATSVTAAELLTLDPTSLNDLGVMS
ncbi:MAG: putative baseplate assembly protein [Nostoc sp.]|uniref:putative baseplate assembly protein n=1 Tax=Nostoc sp. TaxID=1180 RepID=UPI002FF51949